MAMGDRMMGAAMDSGPVRGHGDVPPRMSRPHPGVYVGGKPRAPWGGGRLSHRIGRVRNFRAPVSPPTRVGNYRAPVSPPTRVRHEPAPAPVSPPTRVPGGPRMSRGHRGERADDGFGGAVYRSVFEPGRAGLEEWDRDMRRQNRFAQIGRGTLGGSADAYMQGRQMRGFGDLMAGLAGRARAAQFGAERNDWSRGQQAQLMAWNALQPEGAYDMGPQMFQALPDLEGMRDRGTWDLYNAMGQGFGMSG